VRYGFIGLLALSISVTSLSYAQENIDPSSKSNHVKLSKQEIELANRIYSARLLEIAAEYKNFQRVDQTVRWSPTRCYIPPMPPKTEASISLSKSEETHGRKLYFLYARYPSAYMTNIWGLITTENEAEPIKAPLGQVLVKEAWEPVKVDVDQIVKSDKEQVYAQVGETKYHAGKKNGLYIMFKTKPGTPNTDDGWVYGTVSPDGNRITSVGLVKNCIQCHRNAAYDRQIGLSGLQKRKNKSIEVIQTK
jgi:hypothetical protein